MSVRYVEIFDAYLLLGIPEASEVAVKFCQYNNWSMFTKADMTCRWINHKTISLQSINPGPRREIQKSLTGIELPRRHWWDSPEWSHQHWSLWSTTRNLWGGKHTQVGLSRSFFCAHKQVDTERSRVWFLASAGSRQSEHCHNQQQNEIFTSEYYHLTHTSLIFIGSITDEWYPRTAVTCREATTSSEKHC